MSQTMEMNNKTNKGSTKDTQNSSQIQIPKHIVPAQPPTTTVVQSLGVSSNLRPEGSVFVPRMSTPDRMFTPGQAAPVYQSSDSLIRNPRPLPHHTGFGNPHSAYDQGQGLPSSNYYYGPNASTQDNFSAPISCNSQPY